MVLVGVAVIMYMLYVSESGYSTLDSTNSPHKLDDSANSPESGPSKLDDSANRPESGPSKLDDPTNSPVSGLNKLDDPANSPESGPNKLDDPTNSPVSGPNKLDDSANSPECGPNKLYDPTNNPESGPNKLNDPTNSPVSGPNALVYLANSPKSGQNTLANPFNNDEKQLDDSANSSEYGQIKLDYNRSKMKGGQERLTDLDNGLERDDDKLDYLNSSDNGQRKLPNSTGGPQSGQQWSEPSNYRRKSGQDNFTYAQKRILPKYGYSNVAESDQPRMKSTINNNQEGNYVTSMPRYKSFSTGDSSIEHLMYTQLKYRHYLTEQIIQVVDIHPNTTHDEECTNYCPKACDRCKLESAMNCLSCKRGSHSFGTRDAFMCDNSSSYGNKPWCIEKLVVRIEVLEPGHIIGSSLTDILSGKLWKKLTNLRILLVNILYLDELHWRYKLFYVRWSKSSFEGLHNLQILEFYGVNSIMVFPSDCFKHVTQMKALILYLPGQSKVEFNSNITFPSMIKLCVSINIWNNVSILGEYTPNILDLIIVSSRTSGYFSAESFYHFRNTEFNTLIVVDTDLSRFDGLAFQHTTHLKLLDVSKNAFLSWSALYNFTSGLHYTELQELFMDSTAHGIKKAKLIDPIIQNLSGLFLTKWSMNGYVIQTSQYNIFSTTLQHLSTLSMQSALSINYKYLLHDLSCMKHLRNVDLSMSEVHVASIDIKLLSALHKLNISAMSLKGKMNRTITIYCDNGISKLNIIDITKTYVCVKVNIVIKNCTFPQLTTLKAAHTKVGTAMEHALNRKIFQSMIQLKYLDLTNTSVSQTTLQSNIFSGLLHLSILHLGKNNITNFVLNIKHMTMLKLLDLSYNSLTCLSHWFLKDLDFLQKINNVSLDLRGNNFICKCACIPFLHWLTTTKVNIIKQGSLACFYDKLYVLKDTELLTVLRLLEISCFPLGWLIDELILVIVCVFGITIASIYFRCRYIIKYKWLRLRMKAKQHLRANKHFKYDAFICYNYADYDFVRHQLFRNLEEDTKDFIICFHHRNFLPGATIVDNITEAVEDSRFAILVVSQNSVNSKWWIFELNMAHQVSIERQDNMIICVFLEDIPEDTLPPVIGRILKLFTCLKWPKAQDRRELFWAKLKNALLKP